MATGGHIERTARRSGIATKYAFSAPLCRILRKRHRPLSSKGNRTMKASKVRRRNPGTCSSDRPLQERWPRPKLGEKDSVKKLVRLNFRCFLRGIREDSRGRTQLTEKDSYGRTVIWRTIRAQNDQDPRAQFAWREMQGKKRQNLCV